MSSDARIRSAARAAAANSKKQKMSPPFDSLLFADDLILIEGIFPFVGVGQYAFVGAVNKKMNQLYKEYCKIELNKNPRKVNDKPASCECDSLRRSAESTDTLCSETFCNQPRAEYWLKDNSRNKKPDRHHVCNAIATVGNITIMQWARQKGFRWYQWTSACAAQNGHLEMLQWLRQNGCLWNELTCASAKWAHENVVHCG
ncbi:ankyrin repeat protein (Partial), partial [Seminavis robusta]